MEKSKREWTILVRLSLNSLLGIFYKKGMDYVLGFFSFYILRNAPHGKADGIGSLILRWKIMQI
jgi:hypothetical protein